MEKSRQQEPEAVSDIRTTAKNRAGETVHWVEVSAAKSDISAQSLEPAGGRRELTPVGCPLGATYCAVK